MKSSSLLGDGGGLPSAFFGLHSIGLYSSAVTGLSAACASVTPGLPVMRHHHISAQGTRTLILSVLHLLGRLM